MYYLFGTLVTHYGSASVNHGQRKGNISPLQKAKWHNKIHSTVNADAIRWALRFYWQQHGYPVNRNWDVDIFENNWLDESFDPVRFIDDDVLGYMITEAAKKEVTDEVNNEDLVKTEKPKSKNSKKKKKGKPKGKSVQRLGALGVNRAFSLTPYDGGITFNAKSDKQKDRTSLHFSEFHNTRYQYVFALDSNHLKDKSRIFAVLDGLMSIRKVGGHNNVFCYDFSPESMVFRWTEDSSPNMFYCVEQQELKLGVYANPTISSDLIESVQVRDIDAEELWIGGKVAKSFELENAHIFLGRKRMITELKKVIARDLNLPEPPS